MSRAGLVSAMVRLPWSENVDLLDDAVVLVDVDWTSALLGGGQEAQQVDEDVVVVPGDLAPAVAVEIGPGVAVLVDRPQADDLGVVQPARFEDGFRRPHRRIDAALAVG